MSWQNSGWSQDSSVNLGFPFRTDTDIPMIFDTEKVNSIWTISEDINLGFPYLHAVGVPIAFDAKKAKSVWTMSPEINLGFPYISFAEKNEKSVFPVFSGFSIAGTGSGFRHQEKEISLNIPEPIGFTMPSEQEIRFYFRTEQVIL